MKPIHAVVGRFSFDFSRDAFERVLQKRPFEYCAVISTGETAQYFQSIPEEHQDWFISSDIRGCKYQGIDWNTLEPLDEVLIENMRECESVFMEMVSRQEWKTRVSYVQRKRWYLRQLRFWNDYLTRHSINLYLSAWLPHEIPDIVIYHLCKLRGIPVLYFHMSTERDTQFAEHDIEQSAVQIKGRYEELLKEYADTDLERIDLPVAVRERYKALIAPEGQKPALQNVKLPTYVGDVLALLTKKPLVFIKAVLAFCTLGGALRALGALRRNRGIKKRNVFYDAHAIEPDLNQRYVYMPLHFQPEASTTPMAGAYTDQILMAQMLSAYLPDDVLIYVKEHYRESSFMTRDITYYQDFLDINNVRLVDRDVDSFALREHCSAVATATGTVGVEAIFRAKPVFMFGHRFYQYARGVYTIRTTEDLRTAVREVFEEGKRPSLKESVLYLKAMDDTCVHGTLNPWDHKASKLSDEEHAHNNAEAILSELSFLEAEIAACL